MSAWLLPWRGLTLCGAILGAISHLVLAGVLRAVGATVESPVGFHAVAYDLAVTVRALRRECMDGAFEAVECVGLAITNDLECLVVVVSADVACGHRDLLFFEK